MTEQIEQKIEKLLRMADGTANENESATALQMAQKLADAYNLDLNVIGKSGSRKDEQISKGLYQYQRTLYNELGTLNHCRVWISKGLVRGSKYQTRLLGSRVNVALTKRMADYVEDVANRLVRENFPPNGFFTKGAHLYREGVIDRMVERIKHRRAEEEAERLKQKREQEARMRHPGAATENAIVLISDVREAEHKANYDYLNGEGAWDRQQEYSRQLRLRREEALAEAERYEREHPEEAAAAKKKREEEYQRLLKKWEQQERKRERAAEKRRQERINRYGYDPKEYEYKPTKYDSREYNMGFRHAEEVGLDDQIDQEQRKGIE